ncbi:secretoglobin family 3A member 1 [Perognathus longimembris pacificus]|uniref:secretoglobin family 3A member 1 n=1 Tax=Perognathus longimembris pacificus TaxID=214514 RepID=UPI00201A0E0D|nr:secretoglobin family 3A member 1 [Perognathus longimembris pacificus]
MKLVVLFVVLCVALLGDFGDAFFVDSLVKPVAEPAAALAPSAVHAVAEAVPGLPLNSFTLLKMVLASMGIPVEHLIEGSRKCVTELGPEAVGAVKTLLVTQASRAPLKSLKCCPSPLPGEAQLLVLLQHT